MFLNSPNKFKTIIYTSTFLCLFVQIILSTPQPLPAIISAATSDSEILDSATDILESENTTNITGSISASLNATTNTTGQNSTSLNITTKDTTNQASNSTELGINSNDIADTNSVNGTITVEQADSSNITVNSTTGADATNSTMNSATNITLTNSIIDKNSTTDADGANPIVNITVTNSTSNVNATDSITTVTDETISTTNVTVTNSTVNNNTTNLTNDLNVTIGNATNQNLTLDNSILGNETDNKNSTASSLNNTDSLNTTTSNLTLSDITVNVTNQTSNTVIPPNSTISGTNLTSVNGANTTNINSTNSTNINGTNVTNVNGTNMTNINGTNSTNINSTNMTNTNSTNTNGSTLLPNPTNTTNSTLNESNATNNTTNNATNSTTKNTENYLIGLKGNLLFIPHTMNSKLVRKYENGSVENLWINNLAFSGNGTVDLSRNISLTQCEPDGIESDGLTTDDLDYFPFYTEFYTKILELNSTGQVNLTILDYDWRLPYFCIVPKIKDAVEQLYQRNNKKVNVIAHGTGGLIYMLAMNNETSIANQTNSVAFVGTPFEGQVWGYYQLWFGQTVGTNSQALDFTKIFTFGSIYSALCVDCFVDADNKTIELDPYKTDDLIKNSFVRALIGDLEESAAEIAKKVEGFRPIDSTVGTAAAKIQAIRAYVGYAKEVQNALKYRTDINYPKLIVGLSKSDASTPSIIPVNVKGDSTVYLKADSEGEPGSRIFLDYQKSILSPGDGLTPYKNCKLDPQFKSTEILSNQTFMRLLDDKIMMQQLIAEMQ